MSYTKIQSELNDIENMDLMKSDDETLEDTLVRLEEIMEVVDDQSEKDDEDGESSEIMEQVEELQYSINAELDGRYEESYEEDY